MIKFRSITARLTLFFSTASTLVLLAMGTLVGSLVDRHFEEQDLNELSGKLELVRHALAGIKTSADLETVPRHLEDALIGHPDLSVMVRGGNGALLFATSGQFARRLLEQPPQGSRTGKTMLLQWQQNGEVYRGISAPALTGIPEQPPAAVALAINIEHHRVFMQAFQFNLWLAIASGIALTGVLGWLAARRGLAPVREMTDLAQGISVSHLSDRLAAETVPAELVDLAVAFNEMLARLEDSFQRLSDFSSDLAHELRTPISNLMTQTQVALSKERSIEEYREVLYSNLEEFERLARMISDMLFLAKADNGLLTPSNEPIELSRELSELFAFYEAFAEAQEVTLVLAGEGRVSGDRLMLRRAFSNLLSNAIRHTPRHGKVNVAIDQTTDPGNVRIIFENMGECISPEYLPRLFDRFYRVDSSRHKATDGTGLGLAITESIVESHKGNIQAYSANGLTRFMISLPGIAQRR